jgi:hypothetical protein
MVGQTGRFAWFCRKIALKGARQSGQFAIPLRRYFHSFRASQCDMKAPAENQSRKNEEHEVFLFFFVSSVSSWLILIVFGRRSLRHEGLL